MQYLPQLRMQEARRMLKGEETVGAIGEAVGYQSEAAFHRAFKKVHGVGPGAYRRQA